MKRFAGIYTPIVTPFTSDDEVDEAALRHNVAHWMTTPLTGLVVLGSNGEAPQLDDDEADRVVEIVRAGVPASRPLIVGSGRESTRATIAATRRAAALGADAALVRTPSFFKSQLTTDIFVRHYTEIADAASIPVLLYNVTMFTGVNLQPDAVARLAEHPNIVGVKDSGGDIGQLFEYVSRTTDFTVLAGSATTLVHALAAGCDGAILALAALFPDACTAMREHVQRGDLAAAQAIQRQLMGIARAVGTAYGVPGLKAAMNEVGLTGGWPRPPLRPAPPAVVATIREQLEQLGRLQAHRLHN